MESIIVKPKHQPVFPCIMRCKDSGKMHVLFIGEQKGMVLEKGTSDFRVGHYAENWVNALSEDTWEIIPDITINFKL